MTKPSFPTQPIRYLKINVTNNQKLWFSHLDYHEVYYDYYDSYHGRFRSDKLGWTVGHNCTGPSETDRSRSCQLEARKWIPCSQELHERAPLIEPKRVSLLSSSASSDEIQFFHSSLSHTTSLTLALFFFHLLSVIWNEKCSLTLEENVLFRWMMRMFSFMCDSIMNSISFSAIHFLNHPPLLLFHSLFHICWSVQ